MTTEFKYFDLDEFACQETGENGMDPDFIHGLDKLRERCGFPFKITSGYRSTLHSVERAKPKPGRHTEGIAADIAVANGVQRMKIVEHAIYLGFTGIGVAKTFVHVDARPGEKVLWAY